MYLLELHSPFYKILFAIFNCGICLLVEVIASYNLFIAFLCLLMVLVKPSQSI